MIDIQEKLELEEKKNKEKIIIHQDTFNTDAIDSVLNGTNNEEIEILFKVNKTNIKQEEEIFNKY